MCTVTFLPLADTFVFTSNRDESIERPLALAPAIELMGGKRLLFPKDPGAGGTWFATAEDGTIGVLLNGAFVRHTRLDHYRKSRGLVLLDIISNVDPLVDLYGYDLNEIEPFTVILFSEKILFEFRWDGETKHFEELDMKKPHIYSSATLYEPRIIAEREQWFDEFLHDQREKTPESIRAFHSSAGRGDAQNGLIINRGGVLRTQCITQAVWRAGDIDFYHHDLILDHEHHIHLPIITRS